MRLDRVMDGSALGALTLRDPAPRERAGSRFTAFGPLAAGAAGGGAIALPVNRKTRAVLAILLVEHPQAVARDTLCALLWPGRAPAQARASLRQALHELSVIFRSGEAGLLSPSRDDVALNASGVTCDVWEAQAATALAPMAAARVAERLATDLRGLGPAFEAWRAEAEARLLDRARIVAETALALADNPDARAEAGELLLLLDPGHRAGWETRLDAAAREGDAPRLAEIRASMLAANARAAAKATVSRRWSVSVMPFATLGDAPAEAGSMLATMLAAALPRLRWLSVLAPGAAPEQAMFRLEGTVRHAEARVWAVVRLVDAERGEILWAETFDGAAAPEGVVDQVCARCEPALLLRAGEIAGARMRGTLDDQRQVARDLVFAAIPPLYRLTRDQFARAGALLSAAIGRDPDDPVAHGWSAYWHVLEAGQGWTIDAAQSIRRAGSLAERAVALDPLDARGLAIAGHVRAFLHRAVDEALALHAHALSRNPGLPLAWTLAGLALAYAGRHDEALAHVDRALALAPNEPHGFFTQMAKMVPLLATGRDDEVVENGRQAAMLNPALSSTYKGWLSALGHLGRRSEQLEVRARLLLIEPGFSIRRAVTRSPYRRPADRERYVQGLRLAGLPE